MTILIKNARIVDAEKIVDADIQIEGNKISSLSGKDSSDQVIDASGKLVLPAFYNTHTHIAMVFLRNAGEGLTLHDWLEKKIWPAEANVDETTLYYSALLGYIEAMKSGTACINDMYLKGLEKIISASKKSGIRSVIAYGMFDIQSNVEQELEKTRRFFSIEENSPLIKRAVSCHAPYTCSEELLLKGKELARKLNVLFHIHVSETRKEVFDILKQKGKRPVEYLSSLGILDENTILAHASWVTKREISIVAESKAVVSHNPASNLKLATGGIMPFQQYIDAGVLTTIATDGPASNNNMDMVETMKLTGLLQKHKYWDPTIGHPLDVFRSATLNGAKALGFKAGLIKEGYLADLIIVDPKENMFPLQDYYTSIVYSMKRDNVEKLIVDGKLIYDNHPLNIKPEEIEKAKEKITEFLHSLS